jgi:hypothetical protein
MTWLGAVNFAAAAFTGIWRCLAGCATPAAAAPCCRGHDFSVLFLGDWLAQGRAVVHWPVTQANLALQHALRCLIGYVFGNHRAALSTWGSTPKSTKISEYDFRCHFERPSRDIVHETGNVTEFWSILMLLLGVTRTTVNVTPAFRPLAWMNTCWSHSKIAFMQG